VRDLFGIEIECYLDGTEHRYRITDATGDEYFQRWLLNSIAASRIVADSREVAQNIYVEPVQDTFLPILLEALKGNHTLKFNYQPFWKETPFHYRGIQPYALKMFERRWYLIARRAGEYRIFALDRMTKVEVQDETYKRDLKFDLKKMFEGTYGIIVDDTPVESIRLKVNAYQANYLRSLPLHSSQHELKRTEEYSVFSLRVRPTFDFKQKLLSLGSTVEVLQPESLRADMRGEIQEMMNKYQDDDE
jgi:predicted DNA-binding transcriptional regulator YafY